MLSVTVLVGCVFGAHSAFLCCLALVVSQGTLYQAVSGICCKGSCSVGCCSASNKSRQWHEVGVQTLVLTVELCPYGLGVWAVGLELYVRDSNVVHWSKSLLVTGAMHGTVWPYGAISMFTALTCVCERLHSGMVLNRRS